MSEYNQESNKIGSQKQTSVSKLFEQTVLGRTFSNETYFRKTVVGKSSNSGEFNSKQRPSVFTYNTNYNYHYEDQDNEYKNEGWTDTMGKWSYWYPRKKLLLFKFFQNSSMHGLKFIAQPRRHISERIFWTVTFLLSMGAAAYLINSVWERYYTTPVIVSFAPTEKHINTIPFPSVTICNMNKITASAVRNLTLRARNKDGPESPEAVKGRIGLQYARSICENTKSFAGYFNFADSRGKVDSAADLKLRNETLRKQVNNGSGIVRFMFETSPRCDEMVLKCIWAGKTIDCKHMFKPIYTSIGKCCSFNILPIRLLLTDITSQDSRLNGNINKSQQRIPRWSDKELEDWKQWDYTKGFSMDLENDSKSPYPWRQIRAGAPFGLSILLDPDVDNYFCPSSDSQGFRIGFTTPLEVPRVADLGFAVGVNRETSINVFPKQTLADPGIQRFDSKHRQCLYEDELHLDYYQPYSATNCILECTSKTVEQTCSCVPFSLPRMKSSKICSTKTINSAENDCVESIRKLINKNVRQYCGQCIPLCSELSYGYKVTAAKLQDNKKLWFDIDQSENSTTPPRWADHKLSVVHIFFGRHEFVPLIRSDLFSYTDLIANTGNVLCLCLGFSVMSAAEIVFFFAIRPCWGYFRNQKNRRLLKTRANANRDGKSQHENGMKNNRVNIIQEETAFRQTPNRILHTE